MSSSSRVREHRMDPSFRWGDGMGLKAVGGQEVRLAAKVLPNPVMPAQAGIQAILGKVAVLEHRAQK